ncbi:MAG: hypothetical protein RIQ51_1655 [Bacteroidota bacterium]
MVKNDFKTVDEYIQSFSKKTQVHLKSIRAAIKSVAPDAAEQISYCMPAYKVNKKPFIYFGAYEKHIGFYATPNTHEKFAKQLSKYKQGKGSVQFPIEEPMPIELITKMIQFKLKSMS